MQAPADHVRVGLRPDEQRPVAHEQPLQRLDRDAGRRPGRGVAGRDLAGIGEAGLQRRPVLAVERPRPRARPPPDSRREATPMTIGLGAQVAQQVAAVLGQRHHPTLVDLVALGSAIHQHPQAPADQVRVGPRPDEQRAVAHEQPLQRLERNAWRCPGRGIAGRNLTGIGKAGFERWPLLPVEDDNLMPGLGEVVRAGDPDHAAAQHDHTHDLSLLSTCLADGHNYHATAPWYGKPVVSLPTCWRKVMLILYRSARKCT